MLYKHNMKPSLINVIAIMLNVCENTSQMVTKICSVISASYGSLRQWIINTYRHWCINTNLEADVDVVTWGTCVHKSVSGGGKKNGCSNNIKNTLMTIMSKVRGGVITTEPTVKRRNDNRAYSPTVLHRVLAWCLSPLLREAGWCCMCQDSACTVSECGGAHLWT